VKQRQASSGGRIQYSIPSAEKAARIDHWCTTLASCVLRSSRVLCSTSRSYCRYEPHRRAMNRTIPFLFHPSIDPRCSNMKCYSYSHFQQQYRETMYFYTSNVAVKGQAGGSPAAQPAPPLLQITDTSQKASGRKSTCTSLKK